MRQLLRRAWFAIRQGRFHDELNEEFAFHREMAARELEARGLAPVEAASVSRRQFGSSALARDAARDVWIWPWLQDVAQDCRFATRMLRKNRRFTLAAVGALALGIGANNTVFAIMNGTLLRPLPFDGPDRLVSINARDAHGREIPPSYPDFLDWRSAARTFAVMAGEIGTAMNLSGEDRPAERVVGSYVSADMFRMLGRKPILGRDFAAEDDRIGAPPVVILGNGVWKRRYGGDPGVIGASVRINDLPSVIVGVMPDGLSFPFVTEVWQPLALFSGVPDAKRGGKPRSATPNVFGRLANGVTLAQAQTDLNTAARRLAAEYPDTNAGISPRVSPLRETYVGTVRPLLLALMGVVVCVLLIACVNVANLLLARSTQRSREIAIRASLGATRWRIVRQLLIESALLAALAGVVGLAASIYGVRLISAAVLDPTQPTPFWLDWAVDNRGYLFLVAISCLATLLFGLLPALHISRTDVHETLKDGGRSASGGARARRWTSVLMVGELALTVVLLAGAGLMLRSFVAVYRAGQMIDTTDLITMRLAVANAKYPTGESRKRFFEQLHDRVALIPGVSSVTVASDIPLMAMSNDALATRQFTVDGRVAVPGEPPSLVTRVYVGDGYFETLKLHTLRGRGFQPSDGRAGQEGAIVNQRLASMFFGDGEAIGHRIRLTQPNVANVTAPWLTIIGVSPTVAQFAGAKEPDPVVYVPVRSETTMHRFASVIVRAPGGLTTVAPQLRAAVRSVDPDLPLYYLQTMDQTLAMSRLAPRLWGALFGFMALAALVLASVGLYAVTAHGVEARTQEIGLRMALGARASQVVWMFVRRTIVQLSIGLLVGLAGALAGGRALQSFLVQTGPRDPVTLAVVCLILVVVALTASVLPARRSALVDPVTALRYE